MRKAGRLRVESGSTPVSADRRVHIGAAEHVRGQPDDPAPAYSFSYFMTMSLARFALFQTAAIAVRRLSRIV
jgi:hypothetical protein